MNKSEEIAELAKALAKAQGQMHNASKDAANPFFKSSYADLASIVAAIKGPLSDNGLAYVQTTDTKDSAVIVETTLMHASGQWISGQLRMRPVKDDPQGIGSCLTYARRYALQAIVGLAADEDDDGNAASGKTVAPTNARTPAPEPPKAAPTKAPATAPTAKGLVRPDGVTSTSEILEEQWIAPEQDPTGRTSKMSAPSKTPGGSGPTCTVCHKEIVPFRMPDMETAKVREHTVDELFDLSVAKFDDPHCGSCYLRAQAKAK